MKGNKFLAALLAASMTFSVVPATALNVFADSVAVETYGTAVSDQSQVTVTIAANGKESIQNKIQAAVTSAALNGSTYWNDSAKDYQSDVTANSVATAVALAIVQKDDSLGTTNTYGKPGEASTITATDLKVDSVSFTDANHWSFNVYNVKGNTNGTYTVTIAADAVKPQMGDTLKKALDAYFTNTTFTTTSDNTLRNMDIASKLTDLSATDDDVLGDSTITYSGTSSALKSDGSGEITVTVTSGSAYINPINSASSISYTYDFKANVSVSSDTADAANRKALTTVNASTYPDFTSGQTSGSVTHDEALLKSKLASDLKDAGYVGTISWGTATDTAATATENGSYKIDASNGNFDIVNVALTYSSDQKTADTDASIVKALAGGSTGTDGSGDKFVTEHKEGSGVTLTDEETVKGSKVYTFGVNTALSKTIQSTKATKAVTADEAAATVQEQIDAQLKKDKVDSNGVTVTVKPVNTATTASGSSYNVASGYKAAKANGDDRNGTITLLVSTSIKNDFYGWKDASGNEDTAEYTKSNYVMVITTNALTAKAAKTITLADKTAYLSGGYYTAASTKVAGTETTQTSDKEITPVTITPTITPDDANSKITYQVIDDSDKDVTSTVVSSGSDIYKAGSTTAETFDTDDNAVVLKISKAGKYTVIASSGDVKGQMTLTVRKNFKDVPATAYFSDAVMWAYSNGITAGVDENNFGSYNDVTRGQFVTWLYKFAVSKDSSVAIADSDVKAVFSDVPTNKWYAKAVQWAAANGVTSGTTATTFSPDQKITRAQALTMLWHVMGEPLVSKGKENEVAQTFTDLPSNKVFRTAVVWAITADVTSGTTPTTSSPDNICPRSQAITFIYQADKVY